MTDAEIIEYDIWQERLREIERISYHVMEYDKEDVIRAYGGNMLQPTFDRVGEMLEEIAWKIKGRLNELDDCYCVDDYYAKDEWWNHRSEAEYAQQLGINYVALKHERLYSEADRAMDYIAKNKLASTSYDKTLKAVKQYQAEKIA